MTNKRERRTARRLAHLHLIMTCVWAALLVPTLVWWRDSLLWVIAMSLYANFVGHFSAWQAARAEVHAED